MTEIERRLVRVVQGGLPLVENPYDSIGEELGLTGQQVIELLQQMFDDGKIRRIGLVPNHYALGIRANGMVVWDIPDEQVQDIGRRMGSFPEVTHCYRRPRRLPEWPYNLFCMVHGHHHSQVLAEVERIASALGLQSAPRQVIFSTRLLKKSGVRLVE
jgi:DNA-binding Lrp family transcriptional regulator